jgi:hypothetical protein
MNECNIGKATRYGVGLTIKTIATGGTGRF